MTIPIAAVAGFLPLVSTFISDTRTHGLEQSSKYVLQNLTGFDVNTGHFDSGSLKYGLMPILAGFAVHWGAGKLGINRMLGRAHIPLLRI